MSYNPKLYLNKPDLLPENFVPSPATRGIKLHEMDLYVTMKCNIRCEFCSVSAGEYNHADLSLQRIKEIIDEAHDLGLEELHFLGGEPTFRKDLEDMVLYASQKKISTRVITNGMLLPRPRIQKLIDHGLGELMISVDGLPNIHNKLRVAGSEGWESTMQCVKDAVSMDINVRVAATAYRDNYDEMIQLMLLVESLGVDTFSIFLGSPLGRGTQLKANVIDPYAWRALQMEVKKNLLTVRDDFKVIMEQGFTWEGEKLDRTQLKGRGTGCNTLLEDFDYIIVRSDGNLYQCVFFMTEGKPIGNIKNSPLKESLQYALEQKHYEPFTQANDKCSSCLHQTDCGTGCRGYAYLLKDDWLKTDPRCSKTDPISEIAPPYYPVCPILKWNARTNKFGGSSEQALM